MIQQNPDLVSKNVQGFNELITLNIKIDLPKKEDNNGKFR